MLQIKREMEQKEMEQKEYKKTNMKTNQQTIIITLLALLLVTTSFICGFLISERQSNKYEMTTGWNGNLNLLDKSNGDTYILHNTRGVIKINLIKKDIKDLE